MTSVFRFCTTYLYLIHFAIDGANVGSIDAMVCSLECLENRDFFSELISNAIIPQVISLQAKGENPLVIFSDKVAADRSEVSYRWVMY